MKLGTIVRYSALLFLTMSQGVSYRTIQVDGLSIFAERPTGKTHPRFSFSTDFLFLAHVRASVLRLNQNIPPN
jgi:hypothetical protein